jgi:hypothetical protein
MNDLQTRPLHLVAFSEEDSVNHWDSIEHHIKHALDFSPDITLDDVRRAVFNGTYNVIAVLRSGDIVGAVVYKLQHIKGHLVAFVMAIGGRWIATENGIGEFKDFLRGFGVTKLQGIARPSVARLWTKLGVTPLYTVMETVL